MMQCQWAPWSTLAGSKTWNFCSLTNEIRCPTRFCTVKLDNLSLQSWSDHREAHNLEKNAFLRNCILHVSSLKLSWFAHEGLYIDREWDVHSRDLWYINQKFRIWPVYQEYHSFFKSSYTCCYLLLLGTWSLTTTNLSIIDFSFCFEPIFGENSQSHCRYYFRFVVCYSSARKMFVWCDSRSHMSLEKWWFSFRVNWCLLFYGLRLLNWPIKLVPDNEQMSCFQCVIMTEAVMFISVLMNEKKTNKYNIGNSNAASSIDGRWCCFQSCKQRIQYSCCGLDWRA